MTLPRHLPSLPDCSAVVLLPCGAVESQELDYLVAALSSKGMKAKIAERREVPTSAFNAARRQYRANPFLDLAREEPGNRVLAVTNHDLYEEGLNFVFGLADSSGKSAVISLFRLRIGADTQTFRLRVVKEAVHELGHTFGLTHCPNPRCVMYFSKSLDDTDRKETDWCKACGMKL